jgi:hypothetical protein
MQLETVSILAGGGLFAGMFLLIELGRRIGICRLARDPEGARVGTGAVDGALFALFGLLIAFTFSGAAVRFDARRQLVVEETNAIGTAWLRLDLLPSDAQPALRDLFRRYLDSRLETYRVPHDRAAVKAGLAHSQELQGAIWNAAVGAGHQPGDPATTTLVLDALNTMFDIVTTRTVASITHPPAVIYAMLFLLALGCALLVGYSMAGARSRSWLHIAAFAVVITVTVYVTLDLEYPRLGLIRVDAVDRALVLLRESMG